MTPGSVFSAAAAAALALLAGMRLSGQRGGHLVALKAAVLSALLSSGLGFLTLAGRMGSLRAAAGWFAFRATECSGWGLCAGLALAFSGEREDTRRTFSRIFPWLICVIHLTRGFFPPAGLGSVWEEGFFPLAVKDTAQDPRLAVFLLEAAFAAIVGLRLAGCGADGWRAAAAACCAGGIFFENLKSAAPMIGFVRTEQVLCAAFLMLEILRQRGGRRRLPAAMAASVLLGCVALMQVAMDKPYLLAEAAARTDEAYLWIEENVPALAHLVTAACCAALVCLAAGRGAGKKAEENGA